MPLKLRILEIVKGQRKVDEGAASEHLEDTFHVWVEEPKPRKFKINLAKATASDLNIILNNVGAVLLMDIGEMVQQNAHAMYLKPNYDIDVLVPAPVVESSQNALVAETLVTTSAPVVSTIIVDPIAEQKPELSASPTPSPVVGESKGGPNRPPQPTR